MAASNGNCRYGNLHFGTDPDNYDGVKCTCKRCPNFQLCRAWAPSWVFDCHSGRCGNCNATFRKDLQFQEHTGAIDCPICLESRHMFIKHPSECGHSICFDCFREQWWPDHEIHLNPREWGFATDCQCIYCTDGSEYPCESAIDAWKETHPDRYFSWQQEEQRQQHRLDTKLLQRADPKACPLCRAHLKDAPNNSW